MVTAPKLPHRDRQERQPAGFTGQIGDHGSRQFRGAASTGPLGRDLDRTGHLLSGHRPHVQTWRAEQLGQPRLVREARVLVRARD